MADRARVPNKMIKPADQATIIKLTAIEPWRRLEMIKQKAAEVCIMIIGMHCAGNCRSQQRPTVYENGRQDHYDAVARCWSCRSSTCRELRECYFAFACK
jgi:hypothetical protein